MILNSLTILNYRNIAQAQLDFSPKINCLIGKNGMGKTNILDAIYFLSFTKSTNSSTDSANIRHGEDMMMVQGLYNINDTVEEISIGMRSHSKKNVKRNKKAYKKLSEHIGLLPLIIVSPGDAELINGGSEERRKLMDLVISQYDTEYLAALSAYNKALQQRNSILKAEEEPNTDIISVFEELMAHHGEIVYRKRKDFINEFTPIFQQFYSIISGGNETVGLKYTSHCERGKLLDVIQKDRAKDRIMGYSLHGIHKDDLIMSLDEYNIKREGSQGQNKTYLISLKLAQFDFLKRTGSKTTPLLLLDDIFDKLDLTRVENIIKLVSDASFGQIFISDTNRENMDKLLRKCNGDFKLFKVTDGNINTL